MEDKLYKFILALFAVESGAILLICIPDTQNNLPAGKMIVLPLFWTVAVTCVFLGGIRISGFLEKNHRFLFPAFLVAYGVGLFALCAMDGTEPVGDWGSVVQGAEYMAGLNDTMNWAYFAKCKNNIIPMLVIAQELKLGKLLGLSNPYWAGMFLNVVQVIITMICTFYVCRKAHSGSYAAGWLGMGMMAATLPVVGQSRVLYTDSLSLCFGILGFVIWLKADGGEHKGALYWLKLTGAGLVWGIGCALKPTIVICVIAVLLFVILFRRDRHIWKNFVMAALVAGVIGITGSWVDGWSDPELVESIGQPTFSYWIAVGLKGSGDWVSGEEYVNGMMSLYGMEAREEYTRQYIRENMREFVNLSHITAKAKNNFASGLLGSSDFMLSEKAENDLVWDWVSPYGDRYWRYSMICTSYFYFILLMLVFSCVRECVRKTPADPCVFVPMLTCLGTMIYLMISESNNRQLYNEIMWFLCGAVNGLVFISSLIRKRLKL
ncbi:MAG: glycosyltransferase family 39 protein [Lachnospiraceae bacterium]|nr:glycosyltransferase family 39 protein [Lachnospiraceae bacterium]MCM1237924.1 glycosyltransferase family 39 protein [Lachnospiraceae bacterium]